MHCEKDVDECAGQTCSGHGVCVDTRPGFICVCSLGFEGLLCQAETDECSSSPCVSGATCEDLIADYRCRCPPGFEGMRPSGAILGLLMAISGGNLWTNPPTIIQNGSLLRCGGYVNIRPRHPNPNPGLLGDYATFD